MYYLSPTFSLVLLHLGVYTLSLLVHSWSPAHSPACSSWMWFQSCLYFLVDMVLVMLELEVLASTPCLLCSLQTQTMKEIWCCIAVRAALAHSVGSIVLPAGNG